jgi:hypothetical protein
MKTSPDHRVIAPPFRVREERVSAAWALEPDKPVSGNDSKNHPYEGQDKCRSGRSKKPDVRLCEQEYKRHKPKEGKEAQIPASAIVTPQVGFRLKYAIHVRILSQPTRSNQTECLPTPV